MHLVSEVIFRRFSTKDLERVIEINRTCLPENYSAHFFLDVYANCPDAFMVAEVESDIVGYVMCRMESGFSDLGGFRLVRKGHIVSIAVKPNFRRRGIATALMSSAISALTAHGASEAFVEVRVTNDPAISLYQKLGFRVVKRIPRYYLDGVDAYVMSIPTSHFNQPTM
ncbi:MAG: ribosomal protein S18-alanine N-acetyltransferase [Candidatus Bathyarchaeia archaeon]